MKTGGDVPEQNEAADPVKPEETASEVSGETAPEESAENDPEKDQ